MGNARPQCSAIKDADILRAEVVNDSVASYEEQSCVYHLQLMDSEACHVCRREVKEIWQLGCKVVASQQMRARIVLCASVPRSVPESGFSVNSSFVLVGTSSSSTSRPLIVTFDATGISVQYPDPDFAFDSTSPSPCFFDAGAD